MQRKGLWKCTSLYRSLCLCVMCCCLCWIGLEEGEKAGEEQCRRAGRQLEVGDGGVEKARSVRTSRSMSCAASLFVRVVYYYVLTLSIKNVLNLFKFIS